MSRMATDTSEIDLAKVLWTDESDLMDYMDGHVDGHLQVPTRLWRSDDLVVPF